MRFRNLIYVMLMMAAVTALSGCGDDSDDPGMVLSGTYEIDVADVSDDASDAPVLVALTRSIDNDLLENNPREVIVEYMVADRKNQSFKMDLSDEPVDPDEKFYLIAFVDNNYDGAVPFPDAGDVIGVYAEEDAISPAIRLAPGENKGYHININREVFDYEASISGTLSGEDEGDVTLVAYCGNIDSSDFTSLDLDSVVGFKTLTKKTSPLDYTLNILPYGKNVPIENVQIFALLDANGSKTVDAGDKIGFYSAGDDFSTLLTIDADTAPENIDIEFSFDVKAPCGQKILLSGDFSLPEAYTETSSPVYIAVFDGREPSRVLEDPFASIVYFSKVPGGETEFSFDLSDTGICAGDEVMIIGLWDRDFTGGLPNFTAGDVIGIYAQGGRISPAVALEAGDNSGFHLDITREVFDYEASLSGTIEGNDAGDVTLVAYTGDIESSDFTTLDFNAVAGFTTLTKGAAPLVYTLDILPYGKNVPIENVQIFALLDANGSKTVDAGDKIGFYSAGDDFSTLLTIDADAALKDIDIAFKFDVKAPCGPEISISGKFTLDRAWYGDDGPAYIVVLDGADPAGVLDDPFDSILYFSKLPAGATDYFMDLSGTGICPDDEIMIIGLWDRDFAGGFPDISPGDVLGFYAEAGSLSPAMGLDAGHNGEIDIYVNREVFDYQASISGTLLGSDSGNVILVAYAGEILSSDFTAIDFNNVIGFETLTKPGAPVDYQMDILPYGKNVPIRNVQVLALLDANNSGTVDGGDRIGFYSHGSEYSTLLTLHADAALTNVDIEFTFTVQPSTGFDISIVGAFTVPSDYLYGGAPVFVMVFDSDNPADILNDPFAYLKHFYRMPENDNYFDIDLSGTGLAPGDDVIVAALWDRDFAGGLPNPTKGDRLGLLINKETYQFTTTLNCGKNIVPPYGYEFRISKNIYDIDACMEYAIDLSGAGSWYSLEAGLLVFAIHVEGVEVAVSTAGEIELYLDLDYLLGVDVISPVEYDYIGIGERTDPSGICSPVRGDRCLPILTALDEKVVVWPENRSPEPLIKGIDHGQNNERTAYLVAVLDKNGNGRLDNDDEIGYYGDYMIEVLGDKSCVEIPWLGDILIPESFTGFLKFPSPVKRIIRGRNLERRDDGSCGPYWISNFIENF